MYSQTSYGSIPWLSNTNTLLVKDDVGRAKPSTYNLPHRGFVYGKVLDKDIEGAKEVTMTWKFHNETRDPTALRDFAKLNKMSVHTGLSNSRAYSEYRKQNDAPKFAYKGKNQFDIQLPDSDFVYGKKNRSSTPIKNVMGNLYGLESEKVVADIYRYRMDLLLKRHKYIPKSNKSTQLCKMTNQHKLQQISQKNKKELFKLKKFQTVGPRTNTYSQNSLSKFNDKSVQNASQIKVEDNKIESPDKLNEKLEADHLEVK